MALVRLYLKRTVSTLTVAISLSAIAAGCSSTPSNSDDFISFFSEPSDREPASADLEIAPQNEFSQHHWLLTSGGVLKATEDACVFGENIRAAWAAKHPSDTYAFYYEKNNRLFGVKRRAEKSDQTKTDVCSRYEAVSLLDNLKKTGRKWHFVPVDDPNSDFVAMALSQSGTFIAWDASRAAFKRDGIDSFRVNPCYRSKRRSFNGAISFLHSDTKGHVIELVGKRSSAGQIETKLNSDHYYASIIHFVQERRVCSFNGT